MKELGVAFKNNNQLDKSFELLQKASEMYNRLGMGNNREVAACFHETGLAYGKKGGDRKKELQYLSIAIEM
jgi:hypothetical protein